MKKEQSTSRPLLRERAKGSYWKSGLRDYVLADPEPPPNLFQLSRNYCPSALWFSVNIFPFMPWFLAKAAQRSGFLHSGRYDALIKNYHPPTTKGALARHPLDRSSLFSASCFLFFFYCDTEKRFVFLFISRSGYPRKLNKPRAQQSSLQPTKLVKWIKSYFLRRLLRASIHHYNSRWERIFKCNVVRFLYYSSFILAVGIFKN